ncbi:7beta-hydroxysteroid dehydrogenase (7beta-HSDH) (NADP-dependent 7beta-hydroxysteroid dehydrogenase), partial [Durusdinium trenchii]
AGDFLSSIDVNVKGVAAATHAFGKQLKARGVPGGVVLMSSMVGEIGSAFVANYAATKAYITTLAEGLYDEWWSQGLDALACVAGATITPTYLSSFSDTGARVSWIEQEPFEVVSECLANLGRTSAVATGALNKVILLIFTRLLPRTVATQIFGHQTSKMLGIA